MSFNIALSGMQAASKDLNVTGNNIANAGTVGFKESRAEFADVYASSILGNGKTASGSGVLLSQISQQFNQGNISYTNNPLDMAVSGTGFFQVSNAGSISYTRSGYFGTDSNGYIVNSQGYNLQGYTVNQSTGTLQSGVVGNLQIQTGNMAPKATTSVTQNFTLNSSATVPSNSFNPTDATTYNWATSANIYDAQGNAHVLNQYFVKTGANAWEMFVQTDGSHPLAGEANQAAVSAAAATGATATSVKTAALAALTAQGLAAGDNLYDAISALNDTATPTPSAKDMVSSIASVGESAATGIPITFDTSGNIQPIDGTASNIFDSTNTTDTYNVATDYWKLNADGSISLIKWAPAALNGGTPSVLTANGVTADTNGVSFNFKGSTQYATASAVNSISQNGYTTGAFSSLEVDDKGMIYAKYTNGQTQVQGQVILASFANAQGLTPIGNSQWIMSSTSGDPVINTPGSGVLGSLVSGATEDSNVDLSNELVNLIVAQRNYQANAKAIQTESTVTQTLINLS